jgi:hypothetical protein
MKFLKRGAQRRQQARADRRTPSFRTASTLARGVSVIRTFTCLHGDARLQGGGTATIDGYRSRRKGAPRTNWGYSHVCRFEGSFLPLREEHGFQIDGLLSMEPESVVRWLAPFVIA